MGGGAGRGRAAGGRHDVARRTRLAHPILPAINGGEGRLLPGDFLVHVEIITIR